MQHNFQKEKCESKGDTAPCRVSPLLCPPPSLLSSWQKFMTDLSPRPLESQSSPFPHPQLPCQKEAAAEVHQVTKSLMLFGENGTNARNYFLSKKKL